MLLRIVTTFSNSMIMLIVERRVDGNLCKLSLKRSLYNTCLVTIIISCRSLAICLFKVLGMCWNNILSMFRSTGNDVCSLEYCGMTSLKHSIIFIHVCSASWQLTKMCVVCSGSLPQFRHALSNGMFGSSLCRLLEFASLTLVQIVLKRICVDVHCMDGARFADLTLVKAVEKSIGLMVLYPSCWYVEYDLGYGPHVQFCL